MTAGDLKGLVVHLCFVHVPLHAKSRESTLGLKKYVSHELMGICRFPCRFLAQAHRALCNRVGESLAGVSQRPGTLLLLRCHLR
jgi:hypothetical protein